MLPPRFSDDCSPLPQLNGSQTVFAVFSAAAACFDLRLRKTELGGLLAENVCVRDLAGACACTDSHSVKYSLAFVNESADFCLVKRPSG